jgi:anti-anti-sigma factor
VLSSDPREIAIERLGEHLWRVAAPGERDLADVPALRDALDEIYAVGSTIMLDLSDTTFVDSSIIGVIVYAAERSRESEEHGLVVVAPPGGHPRRVLDIVRAGLVVTVVDDLETALNSVT